MGKFLNEFEANRLLTDYGIPMAKSFLCQTIAEATERAAELNGPVVMKILSADILHKTDAGCVFVGVKKEEVSFTFLRIMENAAQYKVDAVIDGVLVQELAEKSIELIVGMKVDDQFGSTILIGSGGVLVEVYKDVALRLHPVSRAEAKKMLQEIKIHQIITGARGTLYDEEAIIDVLLKVSQLVTEHPEIEEIDINPLFAYEKGKGVKGVDALIKIKSSGEEENK